MNEAAADPAAVPQAIYKTLHVSRGWMVIFAILWVVIAVQVMDWPGIDDAPSDSPIIGYVVAGMLASCFVPPILATSRRSWTLWPDAIEVREQPLIPPLGLWRHRRVPYGEITNVRKGQLLNGMPVLEIQEKGGARYRITPKTVGLNRQISTDAEGLETLIEEMRQSILAAHVALPAGSELQTLASGITGLVILGGSTLLLAGAAGLGFWLASTGKPVGAQLAAVMMLLAVAVGALFVHRYRQWRAQQDS